MVWAYYLGTLDQYCNKNIPFVKVWPTENTGWISPGEICYVFKFKRTTDLEKKTV